ncbi:MAG: hypothetical protein GY729_16015 [Desulfobacteraceae bacterium]|nr:hypothetical protein [Desulfobacteraceae bacterium]
MAGVAIDFGGAYSTGSGGEVDTNATVQQGGGAGSGFYVGSKPNGYAEMGVYSYQSDMTNSGETPGASLGAGMNVSIYLTDAEDFFSGEMDYVKYVIGPFSMVFLEDPSTGELTGFTFSLLGKGAGWSIHEKGTTTGCQGALQ